MRDGGSTCLPGILARSMRASNYPICACAPQVRRSKTAMVEARESRVQEQIDATMLHNEEVRILACVMPHRPERHALISFAWQ